MTLFLTSKYPLLATSCCCWFVPWVRTGDAGVARSPAQHETPQEKIMAVKIRLRRVGRKKAPMYRIVVADSKSPRDGKFIEIVGQYQPRTGDQASTSMRRASTTG